MGPTCLACGAATASDGWCPTCLAVMPEPVTSVRAPAPRDVMVTVGRRTDASAVTFGPLGRTVWTAGIAMLPVPFLWFSGGLAGWGLGAMWWGVVTPWALRDLWRSGRRHRRL